MEEKIPKYGTPGLRYGRGKSGYACLGVDPDANIDYSKTIYVASEHMGNTVVEIYNDSFKNIAELQRIYLPDSIQYIQGTAFLGCPKLTHIRFPDNLKHLNNSAVVQCPQLNNIIIKGVKGIGSPSLTTLDKVTNKFAHISLTPYPNAENHDLRIELIPDPSLDKNTGAPMAKVPYLKYLVTVPWVIAASCPSSFRNDKNGLPLLEHIEIKGTKCGSTIASSTLTGLCKNLQSLKTISFSKEIERFDKGDLFINCPSLRNIYIEAPFDFPNGIYAFNNTQDLSKITVYCNWEKSSFTNIEDFFKSPDGKSPNFHYVDTMDLDFIGFTYNGYHSYRDLKILRVINGNRYQIPINPNLTDKTAARDTDEGTMYFGTTFGNLPFAINIAFDNLFDEDIRKLKQIFNGKEVAELIFDEWPYKAYDAKVTGTPTLKVVCFEENGKNIYKGTGTINFTCFQPFAHTPKTYAFDGRIEENYKKTEFINKEQWLSADVVAEALQFSEGVNYGDKEAPFFLKLYPYKDVLQYNNATIPAKTKIRVGDNYIVTEENCTNLEWDSKTGMVTGIDSKGQRRPIYYSGQGICSIPVNKQIKDNFVEPRIYLSDNATVLYAEIDYQFWYY